MKPSLSTLAAYREHYETTASRIAARLIAARDKGEIRSDYSDEDLEVIAWGMMGATFSSACDSRSGTTERDPEPVAEQRAETGCSQGSADA